MYNWAGALCLCCITDDIQLCVLRLNVHFTHPTGCTASWFSYYTTPFWFVHGESYTQAEIFFPNENSPLTDQWWVCEQCSVSLQFQSVDVGTIRNILLFNIICKVCSYFTKLLLMATASDACCGQFPGNIPGNRKPSSSQANPTINRHIVRAEYSRRQPNHSCQEWPSSIMSERTNNSHMWCMWLPKLQSWYWSQFIHALLYCYNGS